HQSRGRASQGPAFVLAAAVADVGHVVRVEVGDLGLQPEAGLCRHAAQYFLVRLRTGVRVVPSDDRRGVDAVGEACRGQQLLRLRYVVLEVLRVLTEVLALGVKPPAL